MKRAHVAVLTTTALSVGALLRFGDLAPRVETDFFFSRDDPQLRESNEIDSRFSTTSSQLILRAAAPDLTAPDYRSAVRALTDTLRAQEGVTGVSSIATADAFNGPLWGRLLLAPDREASNLTVEFTTADVPGFITRIQRIVADFEQRGMSLQASGVPFVIELIRRNLLQDLVTFSSAAVVLFTLMAWLMYRRATIVLGTLASCLLASAATLGLTQVFGIAIGLLTANLATIIFVLTLSHIVFLTGNWTRLAADGREGTVNRAIRETFEASFWSMATTLLGFLSLLLASAKPLRELGIAGALGAVTAIIVAYVVYPVFLRGTPAPRPAAARPASPRLRLPAFERRRVWLVTLALLGLAAGLGIPRLSTDPPLLTYFKAGTDLHAGLSSIDADGGSSPLNLIVRDSAGRSLDTDAVVEEMWALQRTLENDPAVGMVISPPVFLAEARRAPFMGNLTWTEMLDIPFVARLARSVIHEDRRQGLFFLRMREATRSEPRAAIIERLEDDAREAGLTPVLVGGLFELQGKLGTLIASSLRIGLGGLLILFAGIALIVSRSPVTTGKMVLCLTFIPALVLGGFAWSGVAIDIISSPAANVALAMGVDSMIHLVVRARRLSVAGDTDPWSNAREQLGGAILSATLIISTGFGIFALSTFPPTQRFGVAVIIGTVAAATMALIALPMAARKPA